MWIIKNWSWYVKRRKRKLSWKVQFLENECGSLFKRNNVLFREIEQERKVVPSKSEIFHLETKILNKIIKKCNSLGDKRGLGHANKNETPVIGETMFIKGKEETSKSVASSTTPLQCSICKRKNRMHLM